MKTNRLLLAILFLVMVHATSFAQEKEKPKFTFGVGPAIDHNLALWGINFVNEVDLSISKRFTFTPSLTFYHSIGNIDFDHPNKGLKKEDFSSGIFINPKLKYDILQWKNGFILSFAAAPSFQIGSHAFVANINSSNPESPEWWRFPSKFNRLGLLIELEAEWNTKNPNFNQAVGVSFSGYDLYMPWYIMATYKVKIKSWGK
ncbi:hypothetical protein [Algoriphagus alkaliphilus]|nr:hypothetical protein [Algoriphagus alkaliphilus]